ncbi:NERD domain-containing protein [Geodermatophilus nigrescens]
MSDSLTATAIAAASACHLCRTRLAEGDPAWQGTGADGALHWLCLSCGRRFVTGRPGRSAELEAMRRMRDEPTVNGWTSFRPIAVADPSSTLRQPGPGGPIRSLQATGPQRWGRRLVLSLIVVIVSSPLSSAGATGWLLAVLIGGPAALLFWVSVVGIVVSAIRARMSGRRTPQTAWQDGLRRAADGARISRRPTSWGRQVHVAGPEDNWVKGARGEHVVGAALNGTGLPVLHDRRLRKGSRANIDHLVVAADAVYVVDAKNLTGVLSTVGERLLIDGRDRSKFLDGVRRQADEVGAALCRSGVTAPVGGVLCLVGSARPVGVGFAGGVLLATPDTVGQLSLLPGLLTADERGRIADVLAWAFPPAVG